MHLFESYLFEKTTAALSRVPEDAARDTYALWLQLSLEEDDIRRASLSSLGWATKAHTTPELAQSYGSRFSPAVCAGKEAVGACSPSLEEYAEYYPPGTDLKGDAAGRALREEYFLAQDLSYDRSQEEYEVLWEHSSLQDKVNRNPAALTDQQLGRWKELSARFDPENRFGPELVTNNRALATAYTVAIANVFLGACAAVIRELHARGLVEAKCGRPVPIGIAFSNDFDARFALEATKSANPPGLSRKLEEWMMGQTYEQMEAGAAFDARIEAMPKAEAAACLARALVEQGEELYLSREGEISRELKELGLDGFNITAKLWRHPAAVALLLREIELRASNAPPMPRDRGAIDRGEITRGTDDDVVMTLLLAIVSMGQNGARDAVPEDVVDDLLALLRRLWDESQEMERIGMTLTLCARALHALRPQRFPPDKFGPRRENAGRLLNFADYGL